MKKKYHKMFTMQFSFNSLVTWVENSNEIPDIKSSSILEFVTSRLMITDLQEYVLSKHINNCFRYLYKDKQKIFLGIVVLIGIVVGIVVLIFLLLKQ